MIDAQDPTRTQLLLEQYKLYVEMADRVSARRAQTNRFYVALLTGLLALLSISTNRFMGDRVQAAILLTAGILGVVLCWVWRLNIRSYRQLNSGKFKVVHEMEKLLPFACFDREWDHLGRGSNAEKYKQLTQVESYVLLVVAIPYVFLFFYGVQALCAANG